MAKSCIAHPDSAENLLAVQIQTLLDRNYDLGTLTELEQIEGGYCNDSFRLETTQKGRVRLYFMRRYNPKVEASEIRFEHALLDHLQHKGFDLAAGVIATRQGSSYLGPLPADGSCGGTHYWALFEFLDGKDKYSWTQPERVTQSELDSSAQILAHLHAAGSDFVKPPGADRAQPKITRLLPGLKKVFSQYAQKTRARRCDRLFTARLEAIIDAIDAFIATSADFEGMLELPIHSDFHPGNLKFRRGKGVGLFDFDWSKIDLRLFDVALALVYFCGIWRGQQAGSLDMAKLIRFVSRYNTACEHYGEIPTLTEKEVNHLAPMLSGANLYVLNWDLMDFYENPPQDDDEYFVYIHHNLQLLAWLSHQENQIRNAVAG